MAARSIYTKQLIESNYGPEDNKAFAFAEKRVLQSNGNTLIYAGVLPSNNVWFIQNGDFEDEFEIGVIVPSDARDTELTRSGKPRKDGYSFYRVLGTFDEMVDELNAMHRISVKK